MGGSVSRSFTIAALFLILAGSVFATDYWASFTTEENTFVMKLNDSGTVLIPPTIINSSLDAFMTAMTPGGSRLYVWATVTGNSGVEGPVYRIAVDKASLNTLSLTQFAVSALRQKDYYALSSSQNPDNLFLAFQKKKVVLKGAGLDGKQKWDGRLFRISPRTDGNSFGGGVSSDGLMAWSISPASQEGLLFVQPLKADGIPTGDPETVGASPSGESIASADISNPLAGGKRFVVFNSVTDFPETGSIYLQAVNSSTGEKMGTTKLVATGFGAESAAYASVTIDPDGHFLLYSAGDPSCPTQYLVFQKLDSSGNASGAPSIIVDCDVDPPSHYGVIGVDILKN